MENWMPWLEFILLGRAGARLGHSVAVVVLWGEWLCFDPSSWSRRAGAGAQYGPQTQYVLPHLTQGCPGHLQRCADSLAPRLPCPIHFATVAATAP